VCVCVWGTGETMYRHVYHATGYLPILVLFTFQWPTVPTWLWGELSRWEQY